MTQPVAIVTGGNRGIGKRIAFRLAKQGFAVVLAGIEPEELKRTAAEMEQMGHTCLPLLADVTKEQQVFAMADHVRMTFGNIAMLVNNAAIIGPTSPVAGIAREEWDHVLAVNLTGAFLCSQAVLPTMMEQKSGRIVNISSIAGKIGYPLRSPYTVSKWGLIGLTLTLAKEVGSYNILVNAICPGPVTGPRIQSIIQERAAELGQKPEEVEKTLLQTTLLGRMVDPEHVAEMVAFLASPAGDSMTGQILDISAGYGL